MKLSKRTFLSFLSIPIVVSTQVSADQIKPAGTSNSYVASLSISPAWHASGKDQTITLQTDITKRYLDKSKNNLLAQGEFFLGKECQLSPAIKGQIGGAVELTSSANLKGDILEDADPNFNNHRYNYKVHHAHIAIKGKAIVDTSMSIQPYAAASAGIGFNRAYSYKVTPKIFQEVASPNFKPKTKGAFTYTLEAGAQKQLSERTSAGIGYVFSDWGNSSLSRAPNQTLGKGLQLSNLYTHGIQLSLTHRA